MKATLKYNLPEEEKDFNMVCKAGDMASALWDIEQYLRQVDKYEKGDDIEKIRAQFYTILSNYGINLDNLIE